jgi:hypothetical protein
VRPEGTDHQWRKRFRPENCLFIPDADEQLAGFPHQYTTLSQGVISVCNRSEPLHIHTFAKRVLIFLGKSAFEILGTPDDLKLRSCLTLFREAASADSDRALFGKALDQFYRGEPDSRTLELQRGEI